MDKKELIRLLDDIFIPLDYKRKGNNWVKNTEELSKLVNLQKSNFYNSYYINYGFIIKKLQLNTSTHAEYRLGDKDSQKNQRIKDLLYLENTIKPEERISELKEIILSKIANKFQLINNEVELLEEIKNMPYSSMIPLTVKNYFGLESW